MRVGRPEKALSILAGVGSNDAEVRQVAKLLEARALHLLGRHRACLDALKTVTDPALASQ